MILEVFTLFHVALSLVGIVSGFALTFALLASKDRWAATFLTTTVATSVTGFFFPVHHFMPSHGVGIVSLIVLGFAISARYQHHLAGSWRKTYAVASVTGLYLNFFVLIAQLFQKVPALKEMAPTGSEPPFLFAQLAALLLFATLAVLGAVKFRNQAPRSA